MQTADFGFAQAEDVEQNLVGMFPEYRRQLCRQAWDILEIKWGRRCQIGSDTRLVDHREHRIVNRAIHIFGNRFPHATVGAPGNPVGIENRCGFGHCAGLEPWLHERGDLLAGAKPIAFVAKV